jgi:hypothetical protein
MMGAKRALKAKWKNATSFDQYTFSSAQVPSSPGKIDRMYALWHNNANAYDQNVLKFYKSIENWYKF